MSPYVMITGGPTLVQDHNAFAYKNRLPHCIEKVLTRWQGTVCVAGGFLRYAMGFEETLNDVDLFFADQRTAFEVEDYLVDVHAAFVVVKSRNATTLVIGSEALGTRKKIQLVHRWFFSPDEHIRRFDFTMCQANLWYDGEGWVCNHVSTFKDDCVNKRLVYTQPVREEEPLGSMARALRFSERGWNLGIREFGKLTMQMYKSLAEQEEFDLTMDRSWVTLAARAGGGY